MYTAQNYEFVKPRTLFLGGLGTMGYGLPAAIKRKLPKRHDGYKYLR